MLQPTTHCLINVIECKFHSCYMSRGVTSCHLVWRHVTWCDVMSRGVTSCHVVWRHVTWCDVMSCDVMSRGVTSCHVVWRHVTWCDVIHLWRRGYVESIYCDCSIMDCLQGHHLSSPWRKLNWFILSVCNFNWRTLTWSVLFFYSETELLNWFFVAAFNLIQSNYT